MVANPSDLWVGRFTAASAPIWAKTEAGDWAFSITNDGAAAPGYRATDRESPVMPPRFGEILEKGAGEVEKAATLSERDALAGGLPVIENAVLES